MRLTLNKRLAKLEQAIPSKAQAEAHEAAWQEALSEFGLPPDMPIPSHMPIIREGIDHDGSLAFRVLRAVGKSIPDPSSTPGAGT
jgi:hypothetical protein